MKTELPCHIVRDLLPSYIEGLTEAETTAAVKAHLDSCPDCSRNYADMTGNQVAGIEPAAINQEVDYLKTVRKKTRKKIVLAAVLAAVLVLGLVSQKLFLQGWIADGSSLAVTAAMSEDGETLHLDLQNTSSTTVVLGWNTRMYEDDGVLIVDAREALVSPFHRPENAVSMDLPLEGVDYVYLCGRLLWQEGLVIDRGSYALLGALNPYAGDAPAMGKLVSTLNLDVPAKLELQTSREPYGVTLHFTAPVPEGRRAAVREGAYLILSLTGNLGEVRWDDPSGWTGSLSLEEADASLPELVSAYNAAHGTQWAVPDSVRDCAGTPFGVQQLRALLSV